MILGIGTDIVKVDRIEGMLSRRGDRFAERILGPKELEKYTEIENKKAYLAKRFAAKEAVSKAFGTGFRDGLMFSHIEVVNDELGKPVLQFREKAAQLFDQLGVKHSHLSVSDEKEFAVAFVVLES